MVNVVLKQTSNGDVIQEMSGGDQSYIKNLILTDFSSSDTGVGTVSINPTSTTGLTLIGTFTDTNRTTAPGNEPPNTNFTSTNYNFYQDLQTATENITDAVRPLAIDSSGEDFQRMNDTKINEDFIRHIQTLLAMGDVGSYKLQPTAPTDGGTWVEKATITDSIQSGTVSTTKLWRKSASGSTPATVRPLKYAATSINEMTDADIKKFTARLRNRIVENGIGQYQLSTNAPTSGGTWMQAGQSIADTRYQLLNSNFAGPTYNSNFTGYFDGSFTGYFSGTYIAYFNNSIGGYYSGSRAKSYTGSFSNTFTGSFTTNYSGFRVQNTTETISTMKLWVRIF